MYVYAAGCSTLGDVNRHFTGRTGELHAVWCHQHYLVHSKRGRNSCHDSHLPRGDKLLILSAPYRSPQHQNWVCADDHLATCFLLRLPPFSVYSAGGRRFPWNLTSPRSTAATRTSQVRVYNLRYLPYCGCCQQPARLTVGPAHRTVSILNYGMRSRDNLRSFLSGRYTKPTGSVCAQLCQVCAQDESRLSFGRVERHKARNTRIRKYFQEVVCSYAWVTAVRWWQPTRDDGSPAEPSRYKMAGNGTF